MYKLLMKREKFTIFLYPIFMFFHLFAWAEQIPDDSKKMQTLEQIQKTIGSTNAIRTTFEQTIYKKMRKKTSKSIGEAFFQQPKKFRWTSKTLNFEWLSDGKNLLYIKPLEKSATRYPQASQSAKEIEQIVQIVLEFDKLQEFFEVSELKTQTNLYILDLKPKKDTGVQQTAVHIQKDKNFIKKIILTLNNGNVFSLEFNLISKDNIPSKTFEIPANYKIQSFSSNLKM